MKKLIDAKTLIAEIKRACVYRSEIPGNWWQGQRRMLDADEIIEIINRQDSVLPLGRDYLNPHKIYPDRRIDNPPGFDSVRPVVNQCVACGASMPEGDQVCKGCLARQSTELYGAERWDK